VQEARRAAVAEFFKRMPPTRCDNCNAQNPKIKKQGCSKIFQEYSKKQVLTNYARGIMCLAGAVKVKGAAGAAAAAAEAAMPEAPVGQKRKREQGAAAVAEDDGSKARVKAEPGVVSFWFRTRGSLGWQGIDHWTIPGSAVHSGCLCKGTRCCSAGRILHHD
jgi:hypothetical protein